MSPKSWADSLIQTIATLERRLSEHEKRPLRTAVVGIGHELRGDDAAGLIVAQRLRPFATPNLLVIEGGHAPENYTAPLRRFKPDLIILVDCAQLERPPGTIRWLPWQETTGLSASSHTMPPYMLGRFLTNECNTEVALIGIQPGQTILGSPLSPPVQSATEKIVDELRSHLMAKLWS